MKTKLIRFIVCLVISIVLFFVVHLQMAGASPTYPKFWDNNQNYVFLYGEFNDAYYLDTSSIIIKDDNDKNKRWNANVVLLDVTTGSIKQTYTQYYYYDVVAPTNYARIYNPQLKKWEKVDLFRLSYDTAMIKTKGYVLSFMHAFQGGI